MGADFSGWATKAGLKCSDGRTITPDAFKHQDKMRVPLVWQHGHSDPENVLGHGILEARADGVWVDGFFNDTAQGKNARALVEHGDITSLSIFANNLTEKSKQVLHGNIREVSLVLSGANPGAKIENVAVRHSDGTIEDLDEEAVIHTGLDLEHAEEEGESETKEDDTTVADVYDSMTPEQKDVVNVLVAAALKEKTASHSEDNKTDNAEEDKSDEDDLEHQEDKDMGTRNVFEKGTDKDATAPQALTHSQIKTIMTEADKTNAKLSDVILAHAGEYGIQNIDLLFPDAQALDNAPEFISRRMEWVSTVLNGTRKSPFSRIKSLSADITHDEARAKGYIKGNMKKEEFFALATRDTGPTTIYKKQKLDRDDIIDVTTLDVVAWLKAEMRVMLDEEIARAILVGDGREVDDEDKIREDRIRPIATDDDFYTHKVVIPANVQGDAFVEQVLRNRTVYRGRGNPTMFCTEAFLTDLLLVKDKLGRRLYPTTTELATALRVSNIVTVDVMESKKVNGGDLIAVLVNLSDYTVGADRGGQVSMFDDFDIDFNQYKYLIEGRMSGCLTKYKTAIAFTRGSGTLVTPQQPTFVPSTGVVTIPNQTGVVYRNKETGNVLTAGAQPALAAGSSVEVEWVPATGYYFQNNLDNDQVYSRPVA